MISKLVHAVYGMIIIQSFSIVLSLALPLYDTVKTWLKSRKYKAVDFEPVESVPHFSDNN